MDQPVNGNMLLLCPLVSDSILRVSPGYTHKIFYRVTT